MRVWLTALLLTSGLLLAQNGDVVAKAADEVAAALAKADQRALQDIAVRTRPDPWILADHLCATRRQPAAAAFVKLLSGHDYDGLAAYVADRRGREPSPVKQIQAAEKVGQSLMASRRAGEALTHFRALSKRAVELGWRRRAQWHLGLASDAARQVPAPKIVDEVTRELVAMARSRERAAPLGGALNNRGTFLFNRGDLPGAKLCFKEAREILKDAGDDRALAFATMNLGNVFLRNGSLVPAWTLLDEARTLLKRLGNKPGLATVLLNLSWASGDLGRWRQQRVQLTEALALARELRNPRIEGLALFGLAQLSRRQGDLGKARRWYHDAARLLDRVGARGRAAFARAGRAACMTDRAEAYPILVASLAELDRLGRKAEAAVVSVSLAGCAWDRRQIDEAYRGARDARRRAEELGIPLGPGLVRVWCFTAGARGEHEAAIRLARVHWADAVTPDERARLGEVLASVLRTAGRPAEAIAVAREAALDVLDLSGGLSDSESAGVRTRRFHLYDLALVAAIDTDAFSDAVHFLELRRAGALLQGFTIREKLGSLLPPKLRAAEKKARGKLAEATAAYGRAHKSRRRAAIKSARQAVEDAKERLGAAIRRVQEEAKELADVTHPRPATIATLRAALDKSEAIVWYSQIRNAHGEDWGMAAVLSPGFERMVSIKRLPRKNESPGDLRELLVKPLKLPKSIRRVIVAPDGTFTFLSYTQLFPGRDIVYAPSATTVHMLRAKFKKESGRGVLALGDPDYEKQDAAGRRGGYGRLPGTGVEVKAIGDTVLLRKRANVAEFKKAIAQRPRWRAVHLACHGTVDANDPMLSALALSGGDLTAYDVFGMNIPADLAVLSACETAKGRVYATEGVVGLTRAFFYAGPPRVIVSLWKVDDEATRALMIRFYKEWKSGKATATALRLAQEHVARQPKWKDPKFWAAWQLWGLPD